MPNTRTLRQDTVLRERPATVPAYVKGLHGWQKRVVSRVRSIIRAAAPELAETMKWGQPVYELNGPCCYIKAHARAVNVGFWRGKELVPEYPALQSGGGQNMRHLKITDPAQLDADVLSMLVRKAAHLSGAKARSTRR
jgi:hypothetical protein